MASEMYARMARPVNVNKFMSYFGDQPFSDKGIRAGNICMRYIYSSSSSSSSSSICINIPF